MSGHTTNLKFHSTYKIITYEGRPVQDQSLMGTSKEALESRIGGRNCYKFKSPKEGNWGGVCSLDSFKVKCKKLMLPCTTIKTTPHKH